MSDRKHVLGTNPEGSFESQLRSIKPRPASFEFRSVEEALNANPPWPAGITSTLPPARPNRTSLWGSGLVGLVAGVVGTLVCLEFTTSGDNRLSPSSEFAAVDSANDSSISGPQTQDASEPEGPKRTSPSWNALKPIRASHRSRTLTPFSDITQLDLRGRWITTIEELPHAQQTTDVGKIDSTDITDLPSLEDPSPTSQRALLRDVLGQFQST